MWNPSYTALRDFEPAMPSTFMHTEPTQLEQNRKAVALPNPLNQAAGPVYVSPRQVLDMIDLAGTYRLSLEEVKAAHRRAAWLVAKGHAQP